MFRPIFLINLLLSIALVMAHIGLDSNSEFNKCPYQQAIELGLLAEEALDFNSIFEKELPRRLNPFSFSKQPETELLNLDLEAYGIVQRDNLLPSSVADKFIEHVQRLEGVLSWNANHWDRYPTHGLLNLVDPGLFTFVSGVTRVNSEGRLTVGRLDLDKSNDVDPEYSTRYQMLPTDFYVDPHTREVEIKSYINNLHPGKYPELYQDVRSIFEIMLPLFEQSLTAVSHSGPVNFAGRTLQVAVNIKGVHLDKQHPEFPGSQWHTEGLNNEHIIASGIYYYDVANITQSNLKFRLEVPKTPMAFFAGTEPTNSNNSASVGGLEQQYIPLGDIQCKTGRAIIFPNIYHHRVSGYQLQPQADAGHRNVLVFFLLDPNRLIPSTSTVPPQQIEWYTDAMEYKDVFNGVWPYGIQTALKYRNGFQEERSERKCCGGGRMD